MKRKILIIIGSLLAIIGAIIGALIGTNIISVNGGGGGGSDNGGGGTGSTGENVIGINNYLYMSGLNPLSLDTISPVSADNGLACARLVQLQGDTAIGKFNSVQNSCYVGKTSPALPLQYTNDRAPVPNLLTIAPTATFVDSSVAKWSPVPNTTALGSILACSNSLASQAWASSLCAKTPSCGAFITVGVAGSSGAYGCLLSSAQTRNIRAEQGTSLYTGSRIKPTDLDTNDTHIPNMSLSQTSISPINPTATVESLSSCSAKCSATNGCAFATWTYQNNLCSLYTKMNQNTGADALTYDSNFHLIVNNLGKTKTNQFVGQNNTQVYNNTNLYCSNYATLDEMKSICENDDRCTNIQQTIVNGISNYCAGTGTAAFTNQPGFTLFANPNTVIAS